MFFLNKNFEILEELCPSKDDASFVKTYNSMAKSLCGEAKYEESLECSSKALKIGKAALDKDDADIAITYNNMADVYAQQEDGDYKKALRLYHHALKIFLNNNAGEEDENVADSYHNLATVYADQRESTEALGYNAKALKIRLQRFGEDHTDVAKSYSNMAGVYRLDDNWSESLKYYEKARRITIANVGENHPHVADCYHVMAAVYLDQRKYAEALQHNQKALEIRIAKLDKDHPVLAYTHNNIADVYSEQGEFSKALKHYESALKIYQAKKSFCVAKASAKVNDLKMRLKAAKALKTESDSATNEDMKNELKNIFTSLQVVAGKMGGQPRRPSLPSVQAPAFALAIPKKIPASLAGYFEKESGNRPGVWQKRWFVLLTNGGSVTYYEDQTLKRRRGEFLLTDCQLSPDAPLDSVHIVTPQGRTFKLRTADEKQLKEWSDVLAQILT
jgi:tetratricopeptide (TPR) repeat protein